MILPPVTFLSPCRMRAICRCARWRMGCKALLASFIHILFNAVISMPIAYSATTDPFATVPALNLPFTGQRPPAEEQKENTQKSVKEKKASPPI